MSEQIAWQKGCLRLYKYLLPSRLAASHLDSCAICKQTLMPAPLHLITIERLRLLGQTATKGFSSLLALLEANIGGSHCWLTEVVTDVGWLADLRPVPNAQALRGRDVQELFALLQGCLGGLSSLLGPAWDCAVSSVTKQDLASFELEE